MATGTYGTATTQLGGYDYQFVEPPPDELLCLICTCVARDPQQLVCCGRVFCRTCLNVQKKHSQLCPQCRRESIDFPDTKSDRVIKGLKVMCSNMEKGCLWTGELRCLQTHLEDHCEYTFIDCEKELSGCMWRGNRDALGEHLKNECNYVLVDCPNNCGGGSQPTVHVKRINLYTHLTERCPRRQVKCEHCPEMGEYREITSTHYTVCPGVEICCPFSLYCKARMLRRDAENHRQDCEYLDIPCRYAELGCTQRVARKDLQQHEEDCEYLNIPCRYAELGCTQRVARKDLQQHEEDYELHCKFSMEMVLSLKRKLDRTEKELRELHVQLESNREHQKRRVAFRFKFDHFSHYRDFGKTYFSSSFHTYTGGYKMCIRVDANGCGETKGTHLSLYACLMKGEYDKHLRWPFHGTLTVEVLNQLKDENHHAVDIVFPTTERHEANVRVVLQERGRGLGISRFISHSKLKHDTERGCQYLLDDCLYFQVLEMDVGDSRSRPWLVCNESQ